MSPRASSYGSGFASGVEVSFCSNRTNFAILLNTERTYDTLTPPRKLVQV